MATNEQKRVALVTGANKGIGYETARQLGQRGYTVLVAARDPGRARDAAAALRDGGADAHAVTLDVADPASVKAAAADVAARFGRLDVLVNNAAISGGFSQAPSTFPPDALRAVFDTNFFGAVAVAQAVLPLLRQSPAGRIVNVSSGLGSIAQNADPAWEFAGVNLLGYNASKVALNAFTVMLAKELAGTPVKVNAAEPGYTATDMNDNAGTLTVAEGAETSVHLATLSEDGPTGAFYHRGSVVPW